MKKDTRECGKKKVTKEEEDQEEVWFLNVQFYKIQPSKFQLHKVLLSTENISLVSAF